jgi:hypothetical protein
MANPFNPSLRMPAQSITLPDSFRNVGPAEFGSQNRNDQSGPTDHGDFTKFLSANAHPVQLGCATYHSAV